jgi:signal transduction histidine kinase
MRVAHALLLALLAASAAPAASPPPTVTVAEDARTVMIASDLVDDAGGTLSFDEVLAAPAFARGDDPLADARTGNAVRWMRWTLDVSARARTDWFLIANFDEVTVYLRSGSGAWQRTRSGVDVPVAERPYGASLPIAVPLTLTPGSSHEMLVRVEHEVGSFDTRVPVEIVEAENFHEAQRRLALLYGMMAGSLLALAAYNLLLFIAFRDRSYLYYILFLVGIVVFWSAFGGHGFDLLSPRSLPTPLPLSFFGLVTAITGYILFSRSFLHTRSDHPVIDRVLVGLLVVWGVVAALAAAGLWYPAQLTAGVVGIVTPLTTLIAGVLAVRAGSTPARYYVLATAALVASSMLYAVAWLAYGQALPGVTLAFQASTVIEAILLALALSHRIRILHEERARTDDALRRAEAESKALHDTNEMQTHLLGLAAHDLRSPLTGIIGFADLIEEEADYDSDVHEYAGIIKKDADRMLALINDLLVTAALDGKSIELDCRPMDLRTLAAESARAFGVLAEKKGQPLEVRLPTRPVPVSADILRLRQVLDNLVSNAVKYTPPGRPLRIEVRFTGTHGVVAVTDDGPGLSDEDRAHLFKRFKRLSAQPTGGENSTGLGLSIVRELAELHGGTVEVESTLGAGSTFSLVLPLDFTQPTDPDVPTSLGVDLTAPAQTLAEST